LGKIISNFTFYTLAYFNSLGLELLINQSKEVSLQYVCTFLLSFENWILSYQFKTFEAFYNHFVITTFNEFCAEL